MRHPAETLDIGTCPSADPGAKIVKHEIGHVYVHGFRVEFEPVKERRMPGGGWILTAEDGEVIDTFPRYRDAVREAKRLAQETGARR